MKIFVIGGNSLEKKDSGFQDQTNILRETMEQLGSTLALNGHDLIICSPFTDSADYYAFNGFKEQIQKSPSSSVIEFHYPDTSVVTKKVFDLKNMIDEANIKIFGHSFPIPLDTKQARQHGWLLAQINALETCHVVITLGGEVNGTATLLLRLAEARHKTILPLRYLDGAASEVYGRLEHELRDKLGDNLYLLNDAKKIVRLVEQVETLMSSTGNTNDNPLETFFISYPRARPNEADYIENILRRRNLVVFRDENDFKAAGNTYEEIRQNIYRADVFIAIWCQEYACSPWCFDEFEIALKRHEEGKQKLWIINIDGTRMVPPAARELIAYDATNRLEIEAKILDLLMQS